jgi:beta-glucosidase
METAARPAFRDPDRPLAERVADLLARMTVDEKVGQMRHGAAAVPRLGIPAYNYWNEALHGVARNGRATVFPQAIGLAATWDPALVQQIASAIGDEARAKYHATLERAGDTLRYQGLTFWTPNINLFRDPRWGRGQETWGEDPFLTGELGAEFVRGLQGDHPTYLKAAACAKHFAVHSGPERERHSFDARVSLRDLHESYLPAFRKLVVEARVEAVMGAYNRVNGEPCCASPTLLGAILREAWGFTGHVVSDCGALSDIHAHHAVTADAVETAALALRTGCDLACDTVYGAPLAEALAQGLVTEADLDRALARTLATRFKLGMFDPPELVPYAATPLSVVGCPAHRQLARQAAARSIVLLKNSGTLPIGADVRKLCVIGPNAASVDALLGNYAGLSDSLTTILEGIVGRAPAEMSVEYHHGVPLTVPNRNAVDAAADVARQSDLTIACIGLSPLLEGEEGDAVLAAAGGDRADLDLPEAQVAYLQRLHAAGARLVLVVCAGSPVNLSAVEALAEAILLVWYPGQEGGHAVADLLFGDVAPSGKLPISFPRSLDDLPPFDDYAMAGRTYRYATAEPLYPFGFGLSYARFAYEEVALSATQIPVGEGVTMRCTVANRGSVAAEEVVQLYVDWPGADGAAPAPKLVGFERVRLEAGERTTLIFAVAPTALAQVDAEGQCRPVSGPIRLTIGGCSPGARGIQLGAPEPLVATVLVV